MTGAPPPSLVSRAFLGAAALVAGTAATVGLAPQLAAGWVALFAHGLAGRATGAEALSVEAARVAVLTLLPALGSAFVASLLAGALQALGTPRQLLRAGAAGQGPDLRVERRPSLTRAAAWLSLTGALVVIAARLEQPQLAAALHGDGRSLLAAAGPIAGRLALRVGVGLLAVGLAEHGLARLSLRAWMASQGRRRGRDEEAPDPRLLAELRRRQRDAG